MNANNLNLQLVQLSPSHQVLATKDGHARRYSSIQSAKRKLKVLDEQGVAAYILGTDPIFIGVLS